MNNPFQEQLLKAGLVTRQQVKKAQKDKNKNKQQRSKKETIVDETKLKAQIAIKEKAKLDRELNLKKEEQARNKAISSEIDQLIKENCIPQHNDYEIVYNFEHLKKVKHIFVNEELKQQIIQGKLGIARIEGRYEIIPKVIAEKIQQRNDKRVIVFEVIDKDIDEDDLYADRQIPDDLIW